MTAVAHTVASASGTTNGKCAEGDAVEKLRGLDALRFAVQLSGTRTAVVPGSCTHTSSPDADLGTSKDT